MKTLKTIMAVAALFLCSAMASAFEVDGINYSVLSSTDKTVSVTSTIDEYSGDIVIPSTVVYNGVEYSVTSIGSCAFRNWQALTSVTIPNSVTSIGPSAFEFCLGLTSVTIPNSVTSIGLSAFYKCTSLTSVEIPNSVTTIDIGAFGACSGLTEVVIGNGVKVIGDEAFYGCSKLTSVTMGDNVKSIGSSAFQECPNLTSITIPNSVTNIGAAAFSCSGLTSVIIGSNVASIDYEAFYNCSNLTSITIPNSVTNIGNNAFAGCSSVVVTMESRTPASLGGSPFDDVKSIIVPDAAYDAYVSAWSAYASKIKKTILKDGMIFEMDGVYYNVTSSTNKTVMVVAGENKYSGEVVIPAFVTYEGVELAVTSIGSQAFYKCSGLTSVTIPNSVTNIDYSAFQDCSSLTSVTMGNSVISIRMHAFIGCSKLVVTMESETPASLGDNVFDSVKSILVPVTAYDSYVSAWSDYAFKIKCLFEEDGIYYEVISSANKTVKVVAGENKYTGDVVIPASVTYEGVDLAVTSIGSSAFKGCSGLTSVTIPNSVTSIGERTFSGCSGLTSVTMGNSVINIGNYAFYQCYGLTSVTIPNSVTSIGSSAFDHCSGLTSVIMGNSVTSIGSSAFDHCSGLTSVIMGNSVTSIGSNAFINCSGLTSVTIPNSVTSIGSGAFRGCSKLVVTMESETPASLGANAFYGVKSILVSFAAYDAYVSAWSASASIIKFPFEEDGIYYEVTFSANKTVKVVAGENKYTGDVVIPASVTYDGVELAVTSIGPSAFSGCSGLTSVTIGNSVTSIGSSAFEGCSGLTSVTIPNSVTSIGERTFSGCSGLTSVTIPNSVTSIGSSAFSGCSGLTSVTIGNSVTSIGNYAFSNCTGLTSVTIPNSVTSIGDYAFNGCSGLTSVTIGNSVTSIGNRAFYNCSGLTSVTIPNSVTSIGDSAFYGCYLVVIMKSEIPASLGEKVFASAFDNFAKQIIVPFVAFDAYISAWSTYASMIKLPSEKDGIYYEVTSSANKTVKVVAGENKYTGDVVIPASVTYEGVELAVTSIGSYAFSNCSGLTSVTIPNSVTSIGSSAFSGCSSIRLVEMKSEVTPECISYPFNSNTVVVIPDGAYDSYSQATYWKDYVHMFTEKGDAVKTVTVEAADAESSLHKAIGEENLAKVVDLTINGSINSYDFMVMRNKMTLLRKVDMSNAKIVYNAYEHYTGYHTENDQFPDYAFYNSNLISINLPKDITRIGVYSLYSNELTELIVPDGVTSIGGYAFYNCSVLTSVTIGNSVTSIGERAFSSCSDLTSVIMGNSVTSIGSYAFHYCSKLSSIKLPPSLKTLGSNAFNNCDALTEIRIPASVRTLGDQAFSRCDNLKSVYVYTVEPISISQSTFGFGASQVLYAPKVSYTTYWYNTQWSQFKEIREFDEPYENFYLNGDKELDNSTGAIEGEGDNNPDAEMGSGSGLIVGGDVNQDLGDVEIENGGSIIVDGTGCVNADKLHFHINVTGGKWYFFCFPFDIKAEDIKCENGSDYVFRYYDGEERAKNGKGGWKNVTSDGSGNFIKAGRGYIFQSSATDVLCITAKNGKIKKEDKYNELVEFITQNVHDASWNFVGNPYLSYYEVTNEDYNAPITIWNGSGYEAIRPGDDDYHLAPFEAFFVQKPNGEDQVNYDNDRQMTKKQSDKKKAEKAAEARMRGGVRMLDNGRKMVNITLSDGTATDRTRVVFNESVSMDYEMECDAAKFASAGIPQLYTLDSKQVKYAINERPVAEGMVTVGYSVENQGVYTIAAQRMDTQMVLKDNLTGKIHDFATDGDYTFMTEAGTFDARFALMLKDGEATGIEGVEGGIKVETVDGGVAVSGSGNALVNVYNAGGAVVASQNGDGTISLPAGTYIVSAGEKNVKVTLK